jgi:hypothetical protein
MSATIFAYKRCLVRLYLQLVVGGLIYVICVCLYIVVSNIYCVVSLFVHSGVQHILCCGLVLVFFVLCTNVASFSELSIFYCPYGIL